MKHSGWNHRIAASIITDALVFQVANAVLSDLLGFHYNRIHVLPFAAQRVRLMAARVREGFTCSYCNCEGILLLNGSAQVGQLPVDASVNPLHRFNGFVHPLFLFPSSRA
jgi:hypothetical protein